MTQRQHPKESRAPKKQWDQTAFDKLRASWSPERVARDKRDLAKIFELAQVSPMLAAALDWAGKHDIEFFVDRQAVNCGGYYAISTGVVGLVPNSLYGARAAEVLTHEIRHAWQDYNGLITWNGDTPRVGDFREFFVNDALIEADAYAHGQLAATQVRAALDKRRMEEIDLTVPAEEECTTSDEKRAYERKYIEYRNNLSAYEMFKRRVSQWENVLADEKDALGKKFEEWFRSYARTYGSFLSEKYGRKWGVFDGDLRPYNFEHQLPAEPDVEGCDIHDRQDVLRLGTSFSGSQNYLAQMQPDVLLKKVLRPSLADTFWGKANDNQRKLTSDIRKAFLKATFAPARVKGRLKATQSPLPRHPWP